ncbi:S8 family serine peptidase [Thiolinea disciformis]|uniref:S8 family serine peptidase n=1 Tax=Thiolinea disciformis TaxID=125614 RepID=UPI00036FA4A9|nr:S8 family serine peptidase [Thiolinea disciformis]
MQRLMRLVAASWLMSASHWVVADASPWVDQLIIKYRPEVQARFSDTTALAKQVTDTIQASTGLAVSYKRAMASLTRAHVVRLPYAMPLEDAQTYAKSIALSDNTIEYVEPDSLRYPKAISTNDSAFAQQWYLAAPEAYAGAANLVNAWTLSKGNAETVVAILDSGMSAHADLQGQLVSGVVSTSGYDMISAAANANDGDGRDANPTDPGTAADSSLLSDWHGTQVAGVLGAIANNSLGIAGVGWNTKVLNVRILSPIAGTLSDEVDGMLWAAGESVTGLPVNLNPAHIINLSVGTNSYETCSRTEQTAINLLNSKGISVVVAAGNENRNVAGSAPANCNGVIAVTGLTKEGARAPFANYGANTIAAPAQDIVSLSNTGLHAPETDTLIVKSGTSHAAPMVAGTVALMLAANPNLRNAAVINPAQLPDLLRNKLQATARAFPSTLNGAVDILGCNLEQNIACVCHTSTCGTGMLDAYRAVQAVSTAPSAKISANQTVYTGDAVSLSAKDSVDDSYGSITQYVWTQTAGEAVIIQGQNTANISFNAPNLPMTLAFKVALTDDTGLTAEADTQVIVQSKSSGGGGSLGLGYLIGLLLLASPKFKRLAK